MTVPTEDKDGLWQDDPFDRLLDFACVRMGYCGCIKKDRPLHVTHIIPPSGPVTADQFVEWLFLAENLNPYKDPQRWERHKSALRKAFIEIMGSDLVDASRLRWADEDVDDTAE